jgi:hypothetical protein
MAANTTLPVHALAHLSAGIGECIYDFWTSIPDGGLFQNSPDPHEAPHKASIDASWWTFVTENSIRGAPSKNSKTIDVKSVGAHVQGIQEGNWLKLVGEPGYALIHHGDRVFLAKTEEQEKILREEREKKCLQAEQVQQRLSSAPSTHSAASWSEDTSVAASARMAGEEDETDIDIGDSASTASGTRAETIVQPTAVQAMVQQEVQNALAAMCKDRISKNAQLAMFKDHISKNAQLEQQLAEMKA